ncbi:MAG: hypothetical protein AAF714_07015 [Pseudomonadota bacterium]
MSVIVSVFSVNSFSNHGLEVGCATFLVSIEPVDIRTGAASSKTKIAPEKSNEQQLERY